MKNNFYLKDLNSDAKYFLATFLITLSIGITIGLTYVYITTEMTPIGINDQFRGSEVLVNEIPEKFPKPLENMLLTTHNHLLSFSMVTLLIGIIFYFNSIILGRFKLVLLIEPLISSIIMFGSLWLMKYFYASFVYIMVISAICTYLCWYIMILVSIYELLFKKNTLLTIALHT